MLCDKELKEDELYIQVCGKCTETLMIYGHLPDITRQERWTKEDYQGFKNWLETVIRG